MQNDAQESDRAIQNRLDEGVRRYFGLAAPSVGFEFHEGVVFLRGHVDSFHEKQMAQEIARRVEGVKIVVNRLGVGSVAASDTPPR